MLPSIEGNVTVQADITSIVPAFEIEEMMHAAPMAPPILIQNGLADTGRKGTGTGNVIRLPRRDGVTVPAGTKAEGAAFSTVSTSLSHETLSGGWVGYSDYVTWESNKHGVKAAIEIVVADALQAMPDRVDRDGLALLATATTATSRSGTTLGDEDMITVRAAFAAKHPHRTGGGWVTCLNIAQARDWALDLKNNGGQQLAGNAQSNNAAAMQQIQEGFLGARHGMRHFVTDNVPTAAGDASGAVFSAGKGGPLVYRNWELIGWETDWRQDEKRWLFTVSAFYGWALRDQTNIHGIVSQAA